MSQPRFFEVAGPYGPMYIIPETVVAITPDYNYPADRCRVHLSCSAEVVVLSAREFADEVAERLEAYFYEPPTLRGVGFV